MRNCEQRVIHRWLAQFIVQGRKDYDEKVDVYAFGVVFFITVNNGKLLGISVFDFDNGKKASILRSVSNFLKNLIKKCWSFKALRNKK